MPPEAVDVSTAAELRFTEIPSGFTCSADAPPLEPVMEKSLPSERETTPASVMVKPFLSNKVSNFALTVAIALAAVGLAGSASVVKVIVLVWSRLRVTVYTSPAVGVPATVNVAEASGTNVLSPKAEMASATPLFVALSTTKALLKDVSVVARVAAPPISRRTIFLLLNVVRTPSVPLSAPSKKASTSDAGLNNKVISESAPATVSDNARSDVSTFKTV